MVVDRDGIAFQHRRLEAFLEEILAALDREDRRQCETAAFRLQGAIHAHFDVEAQVIFPALRARRPELGYVLDWLEREHEALRAQLEAVCTAVVATDVVTVRATLEDFREALERHERSEESLLDPHESDAGTAPAKPHEPTA